MSPVLLREAPPDDMAPVVDWDQFVEHVFDWRQGQHVGLIGPTESGKSTLTYAILPQRKYVCFFATKPRDAVLETFASKAGFVRMTDYPPMRRAGGRRREYTPDEMPRRLLWPNALDLNADQRQQVIFRKAFEHVYRQGGWCVVWDEFWMMTQILGLEREARIMLQQARSNDISFVMGAQRPSRIPVEMYDQTTHLFFWRDNDEANLKRIGGIGWMAADPIRYFVANLWPHQVLYINTRLGWMYRTTAPELKIGRQVRSGSSGKRGGKH